MNHQNNTAIPTITLARTIPIARYKRPNPERANLKPAMRAQQRVGGGKLDMRDDDTDEGRYSREVGDEVEDIDNQRELLAGNGGLLRRIGSWSRHARASPRMNGHRGTVIAPTARRSRRHRGPTSQFEAAAATRRMQETPSTGGDYISNATHDRGSTSPQHQRAFPQLLPYGRDGANSPLASSAW